MNMTCTFRSYSAHDGNKLAVNLQFAAEDGTSVNVVCNTSALSMLELGESYVISVDKLVPHPADVTPAAPAAPLTAEGRIDVTPQAEPQQGGGHA